jgi:K+-transporting ATPase ATPase C chain
LQFAAKVPIPSDSVTASGSGLDPHISPANAELQAARIAKARGTDPDKVKALITQFSDRADLGFLGEPRVNVLMLNIALDQQLPVSK